MKFLKSSVGIKEETMLRMRTFNSKLWKIVWSLKQQRNMPKPKGFGKAWEKMHGPTVWFASEQII
jgi:hypothetical protein